MGIPALHTLVECLVLKWPTPSYRLEEKRWKRYVKVVRALRFVLIEQAQELIHSRPEWDAQVVYGDTDSLFVALPGRSKDQAFKIGNDIADAVTAMNPKPVKLKFEKVSKSLETFHDRAEDLGIYGVGPHGQETICRLQVRAS